MNIDTSKYTYECSTKTSVHTSNAVINADGYSSVIVVNSGNDLAIINDNIPVLVGTTFELSTNPEAVFTEDFRIRFAGKGDKPHLAVMRIYYRKF